MHDPVPGPLSDYLLDVLAYTAGIRKLMDAAERGTPLVPGAVEHELGRIERCIAHVLNAIAEPACSPGST